MLSNRENEQALVSKDYNGVSFIQACVTSLIKTTNYSCSSPQRKIGSNQNALLWASVVTHLTKLGLHGTTWNPCPEYIIFL